MYYLDSQIFQEHSKNLQYHTSHYNNEFMRIMTLNPCGIISSQGQIPMAECEQFANGTVIQGMSVIFTKYFENIRYFLTLYQQIHDGQLLVKDYGSAPSYFQRITNDLQKDNLLNLMNLPDYRDVWQIQRIYI